jgi:hypothetical protein
MGKARSRSRSERQTGAGHQPTEPSWLPDPDDCEDYGYTFDLGGAARVIVRLRTYNTKIIEFAMTQQTRTAADAWREVIRIDSAHGEVHAHRFNRSGEQFLRSVLRPITAIADVEEGYQEAEAIIFDGWQENLERWSRGR